MSLQVQVVSPERILWSGDAAMVTARTIEGGDISFLTGHAPFLGALEIGKVIIRPAEGADLLFAVHGGFVEVSKNEVSLLTDVAEGSDQIDVERATTARDRAKAAVAQDGEDAEARAALRRAEVRLDVAGVSVG
ncbi:MAG: synthase, epsilon subunit [Acidimicrobiales bacterium]|nr:synthase, epsilon subunit [Acidimicrobiales bacterium]